MRFGDSNTMTGSGVAHAFAIASARPTPSRGKNPRNRNPASLASPLPDSAASTALAPGTGNFISAFTSIAARTISAPGSLTAGVPASVTTAT